MLNSRFVFPLLFVLLIISPVAAQESTPSPTPIYSITYENLERIYHLYVPDTYVKSQPAALLFVLHGGGQDGSQMETLTRNRFNELAEENGFIVVYPDGIANRWNDGRDLHNVRTFDENIDDVGFINLLIDHLSSEYSIDQGRIYATGLSNGAIMSLRLACDLSSRIAAVAPVAGYMPTNRVDLCQPKAHVSVLIIAGLNDPLAPYNGGEITGGLGKVISAKATAHWWASFDGCSDKSENTSLPDIANDDTSIERDIYAACDKGSAVELYTVVGGGHTFPGGTQYRPESEVGKTSQDIVAADVIWEFFKQHGRKADS